MLAWLLGCSPAPTPQPRPVDPRVAVVMDFAELVTTDLSRGVHYAVGDDVVQGMADGEALAGTLTLPEDADPENWDVVVEGTLAWSVTLAAYPDLSGVRLWTWRNELEDAVLLVPSGELSVASATWFAQRQVYRGDVTWHGWEGEVSIDGAAPELLWMRAIGTWDGLQMLSAGLGDVEVHWEDPELDER